MLVANDTEGGAPGTQRRIQHGSDSVKIEISISKFRGAGVCASIVRDDRALFLERLEIERVVFGGKFCATGVFASRQIVMFDAVDLGAILTIEPDVDSCDIECLRRCFCYLPQ